VRPPDPRWRRACVLVALSGATAIAQTSGLAAQVVEGLPGFTPSRAAGQRALEARLLGVLSAASAAADVRELAARPHLSGTPGAGHTANWLAELLVGEAVWSPDGHWLGYVTRAATGTEWTLWAEPLDGSGPPIVIVSALAGQLYLQQWLNGDRRHAAHVEIDPDRITLGTGHGVLATARVTTRDGGTCPPTFGGRQPTEASRRRMSGTSSAAVSKG